MKVGPTTTHDAASHSETGRKITPEKLIKWVADKTNAITERIPVIKAKETPSNPMRTTDEVFTLLSLPWNSTGIEAGREFDQSMFSPNPNEALEDDGKIKAEQEGDQGDNIIDPKIMKILEGTEKR